MMLPFTILLKSHLKPMRDIFTLCFPYFNAMQDICKLYIKTMFIKFATFLGYLKSKQTLLKSYFSRSTVSLYSSLLYELYFIPMQRLFAPSFPCFNAMQNICELYAKTMFIMPGLFPDYLKSKKTVIKSYLVNCSLFHIIM